MLLRREHAFSIPQHRQVHPVRVWRSLAMLEDSLFVVLLPRAVAAE